MTNMEHKDCFQEYMYTQINFNLELVYQGKFKTDEIKIKSTTFFWCMLDYGKSQGDQIGRAHV